MIIKKFAFWSSVISVIICLHDYQDTINATNVLLLGLGPFEPFQHWMLDFDPFESPNSATLTAKIPGYFTHFISFFLVGASVDKVGYFIRRKRSNRSLS